MVTNRIDGKLIWEAYKNFISDNKHAVAGNISSVMFYTIWELGFNAALASQAQQPHIVKSESYIREMLDAPKFHVQED